jgi:hypothetical protein
VAFILWTGIFVINWTIKISGGVYPSKLAVQDFFSSVFMILLSLGFGATLKVPSDISISRLQNICRLIFVMLLIMVSVALWELLSVRAWAGFILESREFLQRASSLLFNPNVFGFWCAQVAIFSAYLYHSHSCSTKFSFLMLVLSSFGVLLSGSRSGLTLSLCVMGFASILLAWQKKNIIRITHYIPLTIFLVSITVISLLVKVMEKFITFTHKGLWSMSLLVDRFFFMPKEIIQYFLSKFSGTGLLESSTTQNKIYITNKTFSAINGRFEGTLVDNGYLAILNGGGWTALMAWIFLWLVIIFIGFNALHKRPSTERAYTFSMVIGCCLSALFVRSFQVYPFWVFISLALGLSLSSFLTVLQVDHEL